MGCGQGGILCLWSQVEGEQGSHCSEHYGFPIVSAPLLLPRTPALPPRRRSPPSSGYIWADPPLILLLSVQLISRAAGWVVLFLFIRWGVTTELLRSGLMRLLPEKWEKTYFHFKLAFGVYHAAKTKGFNPLFCPLGKEKSG